MMKKFLFLLCVGILTSCQKKDAPYKNYLKIVSKDEPCWMDPRKGVSMTASPLHFLFFEGLMRLDHTGALIPATAKSYKISPEKTTYTFYIDEHARWSNGEKLTADHFVESWKTILTPAFVSKDAYLLHPIKGAKKAHLEGGSLDEVAIFAKDPLTFVVELEHPCPSFLEITALSAFCPIYPGIDKKNPHWAKDASEDFISNGPFSLKRWSHGTELVFEKNEHYLKKDEVSLAGVLVRIVPNEMSYLRMYRKGEVDFLGSPISPIPISAYPSLLAEGKLRSMSVVGTKVISFNVGDSRLKNRHLRRALNYAIDRKAIVEHLTQLEEEIATRALPQIITEKPQDPLFIDGNFQQAREELAQAGFSSEELAQPMIFTYWGSHLNDLIAQQIQQVWEKELGLSIQLEKVTLKNVLAKIQSRSYQICLCAFISEINHPINILERFTSKQNLRNYPGWESTYYREIYEKNRFAINRKTGFQDLEKILMEEFPYAPLYHYKYGYITSERLGDVHVSYLGHPLFSRMELKL
ncbi:MAG: peptide ABC transporter substrate-binding protein [Chlamydiota bacterium]